MLNINPSRLRFFYGTAPQPCPYLPGRLESKVVTELNSLDAAQLHNTLSRAGFRRSHSIAYRPACPDCNACVPCRVRVEGFTLSKSMRRTLRRNSDIIASQKQAFATEEQYSLFKVYEQARHPDGEMASMDFNDYRSMVEDTPVETFIIEFREGSGRLVAVALTDQLSDGLSGVYKFYTPERATLSPGTFVILWHIERVISLGLPFFYLGYWISQSPKMAYKARFMPLEILTETGWNKLTSERSVPIP